MSRSKSPLAVSLLISTVVGCTKPMSQQEKFEPQGRTNFFSDQRMMRTPASGTVSREEVINDEPLTEGTKNGKPISSFPIVVDKETLIAGREKYEIYCTPCHDRTGQGNGMVVQRGFKRPRSLSSDHARRLLNGELFRITTSGYNTMAGYRDMLSNEDRWAIVAYIRVLQLSQDTPASVLSPSDLEKLSEEKTK